MTVVKVSWQYQDENGDFHEHEQVTTRFQEACDIIDNYPWAREVELFKKTEAGGGLFFYFSDGKKYAEYRLIPLTKDTGMFLVNIMNKLGFLNIFGSKKLFKEVGDVTLDEAKQHIKTLYESSVAELYQQHKK